MHLLMSASSLKMINANAEKEVLVSCGLLCCMLGPGCVSSQTKKQEVGCILKKKTEDISFFSFFLSGVAAAR